MGYIELSGTCSYLPTRKAEISPRRTINASKRGLGTLGQSLANDELQVDVRVTMADSYPFDALARPAIFTTDGLRPFRLKTTEGQPRKFAKKKWVEAEAMAFSHISLVSWLVISRLKKLLNLDLKSNAIARGNTGFPGRFIGFVEFLSRNHRF